MRAAAPVRTYATNNIDHARIDNLNLLAAVRDSCANGAP
jgi:hypothetical protein